MRPAEPQAPTPNGTACGYYRYGYCLLRGNAPRWWCEFPPAWRRRCGIGVDARALDARQAEDAKEAP